jgi:hypothetical protein
MNKGFEDYLMEQHSEQYVGTKDCMIDDYNQWVQNLCADELIEYGDKYCLIVLESVECIIRIRIERLKTTIQKEHSFNLRSLMKGLSPISKDNMLCECGNKMEYIGTDWICKECQEKK